MTSVTRKTEVRVGGYVLNLTDEESRELRDKLIAMFPCDVNTFPLIPEQEPRRNPVTWPRPPQPYEAVPTPYHPPQFGPPLIWGNGNEKQPPRRHPLDTNTAETQ